MADSSSENWSLTWRAGALYALLSFFFFVPAFLPGRQIGGSDYIAGGYHFLEFAITRMTDGSFPKWVPHIFGGLPMYANPGGLFYPVRLLMSALLPIDRVMPAVFVVQFAIAGIGMHALVRALGVRHWVALVSGVAFQLTGVAISYVFAGHDGRIIAATSCPLVFFFIHRGVRSGSARWFVGLASILGFVLLSAQIQSAYYLLLAGASWAAFLLATDGEHRQPRPIARRIVLGLVAVAIGFGMAAINLVPFSQYVKDSPRAASANRDYAFSTQFSMPLAETIGFAVPEQHGILEAYQGANQFKLHTEYVGATVILLLVVGCMIARRDRRWQFMAALAAFMMTISYGSNTSFYSFYYRFLPGTSKFRSPSIALFVVAFCLVVMAALTLEQLAARLEAGKNNGESFDRSNLIRLLTVCVVVSFAALIISAGVAIDGGTRAFGWARFSFFFYTVALASRAWVRAQLSARSLGVILLLVTVVDLFIVDRQFLYTEAAPDQLFARDDVVRFLQTQPAGRVWVLPFQNRSGAGVYRGNGRFGPQSDYLMRFGITQAGGEHGNQLYRWNQLAGIAPGGNVLDWHNFTAHPQMMEAAAVRYLISGVPIAPYDTVKKTGMRGIREVFHGSAFVYANDRAVSRVQLVPDVRTVLPDSALGSMTDGHWNPHEVALVEASVSPLVSRATKTASSGTADIVLDDADHIEVAVRASEPALLVLADNYAEGWIATVDGRETPILRTNHTFRGVPVTAGDHTVVFVFRPKPFYAGLAISIGSVVVLLVTIIGIVVNDRRRARNRDPQARRGNAGVPQRAA